MSTHIVVHVSNNQIESLLSDASFESRYWCKDVEKFNFSTIVEKIMKGHSVSIYNNGTEYDFNMGLITQGLRVLSIISPIHFSNILSDRAEGKTADLLMQCCLFGEIIYG